MDSKTKLELGWGNPDFLSPYWEMNPQSISIDLDVNLAYQFSGLEDLKANIKKLHKKLRNANVENKHIVIGNGATHLLNGLIATNSSPLIYAEAPCYHKFYDFADIQNKHWKQHEHGLEIVTIPNNPDGRKEEGTAINRIYDLSYNWPTYTEVANHNKDIMVFGLSKATGHASARIGWAIIKDPAIAKQLEDWIHYNSCGVSYYGQLIANKVIKNQLVTKETVFQYGQEVLTSRWRDILFNVNLPFERQSGGGMFMWCKGEIPEGINAVKGSLFGATDEYFRISVGVSNEVWEEFVRRYGK